MQVEGRLEFFEEVVPSVDVGGPGEAHRNIEEPLGEDEQVTISINITIVNLNICHILILLLHRVVHRNLLFVVHTLFFQISLHFGLQF